MAARGTHLRPPIWIDEPGAFRDMLTSLNASEVIALDTESDSLYSYYEKVCLIQISIPGADYLVDPLFVDVRPLGNLLADRLKVKVFHAAEYDIGCLKRDYAFELRNIFDTMMAARILGWPRYGLASILAERFEVHLDKRFQRYNWGKRPIDAEALRYAHHDSHYLLPLRDIQLGELKRTGRLAQARDAFARLEEVPPQYRTFSPEDYRRVRGAHSLTPRELAVLRALYIFREHWARRHDLPPFKVLNDATLIRLAQAQPQNTAELASIRGVPRYLKRQEGELILRKIRQGQKAPLPPTIRNNSRRPDPDTLARYEALRTWRSSIGNAHGVEPDVVISNSALMRIASVCPTSYQALDRMNLLGNWQLEALGEEILKVLQSASALGGTLAWPPGQASSGQEE